MLFLMPLAGTALGAAAGALSGALADVGINDTFMKEAAQTLQSGDAALFLLIRKVTADKVLAACRGSAARCYAPRSTTPRRRRCARRSTAHTAAAPAA